MIPVSTRLQGFGPHTDTTIEWGKLPPLVAIVAPNGTGKTFALGGDFMALYGDLPSYPGTAYDHLTQNGTGEGTITSVFQVGGQTLKAVRTVSLSASGRTSQQAKLIDVATGKTLAGPKVSDFEAHVASLLGTREIALASWFASQNGEGDLTNEAFKPADRRRVFGEILDFARHARLSKQANDAALSLEAMAKAEASIIADAPDFATLLADAQRRLDVARESHAFVLMESDNATKALGAARERLSGIAGGEEPLRATIANHEAAIAEETRHRQEVARLESDHARVSAVAGRIEDCLRNVRLLDEAKHARAALAARHELYAVAAKWDAKRDQFAATLNTRKATLDGLLAAPGVGEDVKAKATSLLAVADEYRAAKSANDQADVARDSYRKAVAKIDTAIATTECDIARIEAKIAKAPKVPGPAAVCMTCPLMVEWAELPKQLAECGTKLGNLRTERAAMVEPASPVDLSSLIARGAEAREAAKQVDAAAKVQAQIEQARVDVRTAADALKAYLLTEPADRGEECGAQLAEHDKALMALGGAPAKLEQAQEAAKEVDRLHHAIMQATSLLGECGLRVTRGVAACEMAKQALADRAEGRRVAEAAVAAAEARLANYDTARKAAEKAVAGIETEIEATTRQAAEIAARRTANAARELRARRLRTIEKAFGARGIQALLIDQAAPALESIANEMFDRIFDGRFALRVATQRVNRDGSVAEDFSIMVRDFRGERDILRFSGGQKCLFRLVFRAAQCIWSGQIHGRMPEQLRLDEPFDGLDPEWQVRMVETIIRLQEFFKQVLVITHSSDLAGMMPGQLRLRGGLSGVEVEA